MAPLGTEEQEILEEAANWIAEPYIEGCYELVWHDTTPCSIAEFRAFIG